MQSYRHPVLGEITVNPSAKARRLSISVRPGGEVRLTIPRRVSEQEALRFLDEKAAWVQRARERIAKRCVRQPIVPPYATRAYSLYLDPGSSPDVCVRVASGRITVSYPAEMNYEDETVQEVIRQGIETAWRIEAKAFLPGRVAELSRQTGLRCGKVTVRNARTRWGSCSVANDISLSIHLMKLPDLLIDYIILHELCHTRHKNHGPRFHALLDQLCGGRHLDLRRQLKNYSTRW